MFLMLAILPGSLKELLAIAEGVCLHVEIVPGI